VEAQDKVARKERKMTKQVKYNRKEACRILRQVHDNFDRQAESDKAAAGGYRPEPIVGPPEYGDLELGVLDAFLTKQRDGYPVRLAGDYARRLHCALTAHPEADRLALVTLENGNRFAMDADQIDLTSGFSSGGPVRETLIVDARNLRARIERMIEAVGLIIRDADDE
jgi:hypothetical protein